MGKSKGSRGRWRVAGRRKPACTGIKASISERPPTSSTQAGRDNHLLLKAASLSRGLPWLHWDCPTMFLVGDLATAILQKPPGNSNVQSEERSTTPGEERTCLNVLHGANAMWCCELSNWMPGWWESTRQVEGPFQSQVSQW